MSEKSFSVGCPPDLQEIRRMAEDKLAHVCFGRESRTALEKTLIYEWIWSQIAISTDEAVLQFFGKAEKP